MYQMHFLLKSHKDANILFNRTACQEIKLNIFQHFNCSSCEGSSPKRPSKVKAVGQLALGVSQTSSSKQGVLGSTQMQSSNNISYKTLEWLKMKRCKEKLFSNT